MLTGRGRFFPAVKSIWSGIFTRSQEKRRTARMRWYCQFGLAPLSYTFTVPQALSYYLTMEPPAKTDITYYDWGEDNSFERQQGRLDSASASVHLHNRHTAQRRMKDRAVLAYVRCRTREHKQIAFGALLNAIFVLLAAHGRFAANIGTSAQTWLLVTPTVLIAYLAEQQRHYYAHTVRRQRAVLWVYLAISVLFLVTIAFSRAHGTLGSQHWGWFSTGAAWLFAATSVFVCVWHLPLGYNYQLTTEKWAKTRFGHKGKNRTRLKIGRWGFYSTEETGPTWEIYDNVIRKYCDWVFGSAVVIAICALAAIILTWQHPPKHKQAKKQTASQLVQTGTLTLTTWPSKDCKGCNVDLRFVPSTKTN